MLIYANHLSIRGVGAKAAVFKAIGAWLKEQLGYGLHPDQLIRNGEYEGMRGEARSWLRIYATVEDSPHLFAWVLKFGDEEISGRQWVTELGVKVTQNDYELSCIVKTEETNALISAPVSASQPRLIRYVMKNVKASESADFAPSVPGITVKSIGDDEDSYRSFVYEIERIGRLNPIVMVSPLKSGEYPVDINYLQEKLFGLAQVIQISQNYNKYRMEDILGRRRSAWDGAINILNTPNQSGFVRTHLFLPDVIEGWGESQNDRISQILTWVTSNTNILRQKRHIRPEGVTQLSLRRRLSVLHANAKAGDVDTLISELEKASSAAADQAVWVDALENENVSLGAELADTKGKLAESNDIIRSKSFEIQSLKAQLNGTAGQNSIAVDISRLVDLVRQNAPPTPFECIEIIEAFYGSQCVVLDSARESSSDAEQFVYGRQLFDLLVKLVTEYRSQLIEGGDAYARNVFGKGEFAAKESETVMNSKSLRRARTFIYNGEFVEMFRHLKIGVDDDVSKTIRVHFYWDSNLEKIVIGYCGKHLPISSH